MKLYVQVFQAQDLPLYDSGSGSGFGSYVKVKFGKTKTKTRILWNDVNPKWNEQFVLHVDEWATAVIVSVCRRDEDYRRYFGSLDDDLIGRVKVPVRSFVGDDEDRVTGMMPPTWFAIERPTTLKFLHKDCGKILISVSLQRNFHESSTADIGEDEDLSNSCKDADRKTRDGKELVKAITRRLEKIFTKDGRASRTSESSELSGTPSDDDDSTEECSTDHNFEEAIGMMQSRDSGNVLPENLSGGILIDQIYRVQPRDLNIFLFSPNSKFRRELAELEGTVDVEEETWVLKLGNGCRLTRKVSYTKAATKLVKAVRATENQAYLKADGKNFAIFIEVSTPEVPYGDAFQVELLYKLMPGPELALGVESTHLIVSWGVNFYRSLMMKGMIEGGVRQGLKESFDHFVNFLGHNFPAQESTEQYLDKHHIIAMLENERRSDWKLAVEYLCNVTAFTAACLTLYLIVHISLCKKSSPHGLEINGLDLPDSLMELVVGGIIFLQLERAYYMASLFLRARRQRGTGHKAKAQGDGWVLTVALIEGTELACSCTSGLPDPYIVFTCNGKTRMSSVKLRSTNPRWNEILEFDAAEEPPSVLDVELFDFDGPFGPAKTLGYAQINFLQHTPDELADMWVYLDGKLARSSLSKLHLRIFLDNDNGPGTIREYLSKMEKEVGKKLNLQSPHRNSTFQKIFRFPEDEFLIADFSCLLKRKIPLQGRIFLSARVVGFYSNLFGHKTRFFFIWEDIDDILVLPPSLSSVGSPSLVIILKKNRGLDAQHGAKSRDEEGRLMFYFQSFLSFHDASRTIMALWRTRNPNASHKRHTVEEHSDHETLATIEDDTIVIKDIEDLGLSKVYSAELPIEMNSFMELFRGGDFERKIMERSGCLNYSMIEWVPVRPGTLERSVSYKLDRNMSALGGEVTSTQQKVSNDDDGWIVNEVMKLHNIPLADYFRVQIRYQIGESTEKRGSCRCDVYMGISWRKSSKLQPRIEQNVTKKLKHRLRHLLEELEQDVRSKEMLATL